MGKLTTSYVHGIGDSPLLGVTVGALLDATAAANPRGFALVVRHQQSRLDWQGLARDANALAAGLLSLGLEPGERVGIWAPNCAEWVIAQFATAKAGLVLVNVNPAYRTAELERALGHVGCRALITATRFKTSNYVAMLGELLPELARSDPGRLRAAALPELRHVIALDASAHPGMHRYRDVADAGGEAEHARLADLGKLLQFDDPINIQFTSGTTGAPKAATLTHHNIVNNACLVARAMELGAGDRLCIPVPMYHCFGMVLGTLACAACGATMVLPSAGFDAGAVLAAIDAEGCTALHGVPTMFIAALEHPDFAATRLDTLRTGIIAGAPCAEELMKRLVDEMHLRHITIAYGMTETGPVSFQTSVHDPLERRVSTVGRVLPHTEVKVVDDAGRVVPTGETGELLTRGYCVMRGYWNDPERTAEAIDAAGWMRSGDLAVIDGEGYCRIVGRTKDMIIRGGENIFPTEIEAFLFTHPKVEDVQVIGVPDPRLGEEICAWIRLRPGERCDEQAIRDFCEGRIAHFKVPRYIRFVDAFPLTVTGKVQKFRMRELMQEELQHRGTEPAGAAGS
jgi:fatty-acyl-CoA synthase